MKNQALQYDNGKYYYIEGGSTRIEVAPESVEMAEDLCYKLSYDGNLLFSLPEGIYPVQVKVNYKYTKKPPYRYAILSEVEDETNEVGCKCQGWGRRYKVDFLIPDELWAKITPKAGAAGLLCGSCIANRIEDLGEYDYFHCVKESELALLTNQTNENTQ